MIYVLAYIAIALVIAFSAGRVAREDGLTGRDNALAIFALPLLWPLGVVAWIGAKMRGAA